MPEEITEKKKIARGEHLSQHSDVWKEEEVLPGYKKADLGCGFVKDDGYVRVDNNPEVTPDVLCDLFTFPWPFEGHSFHQIRASHIVEHAPDVIKFMEEMYRIMVPYGIAEIRGPYWASTKCFQDPTHYRGLSLPLFAYFSEEGRRNMGLMHYPIRCNFVLEKSQMLLSPEYRSQSEEAQVWAASHLINVVDEITVWVRAVK